MIKTEIFTPFTNATCETLKLLLDVDALHDAAQNMEENAEAGGQIDVSIGITGDVDGEVLYRFPTDTTLEIVKIMSGMEFTKIDEFVMSALGEIANIISGNAVTNLSKNDITCDILPPKILDGEPLSASETEYVFATKVSTQIGDVEILLKLKPDRIKSE